MTDLDDAEAEALRILEHWNYEAAADNPAPAIFFSLYRDAGLTGLRDEMSDAGLHFVEGLTTVISTNSGERESTSP